MQYAYVFGPVAVTVERCVCPDGDVEEGARIEIRRVRERPGNRPGNEGFEVLSVGEGGIWRADLLVVTDPPTGEARYHYHPKFEDGDVGWRKFDPDLTADPSGWTIAKLAEFRQLLEDSGAGDVADQVDYDAVTSALPAIRAAIDACLVTVPTRAS